MDSEYPQVLKGGFLVTGAQQLEENFIFHMHEILSSYSLLCLGSRHIQCGITRKKKILGILYLLISGKLTKIQSCVFAEM